MLQSSASTDDLAAVLAESIDLNFELPDPEDEEISEHDFQQQLDNAWLVCDRFDLQTEIWRGRILRAVRDREKKQGDARGSGFLNWLKAREISKSQAYSLIELANSADTLVEQGHLDPNAVRCFSKRAFIETAKAEPEIQQLVTDAAKRGDRITRREVRQLSDEWMAMSSELLPEPVKVKASENALPPRYLAPLVKEMEKLPESHQKELQREIAANPDVDTIKEVTTEAKYLSKYINAATTVQALNNDDVDLERAIQEAIRVGCINVAADLVNQASQLEQTIAKLYGTWKRIGSLADRLYVDTGASTPHLRSLLSCLEPLGGEVMEVSLGGDNERTIRLQISEE
ncbi:hypothetical protein [Chroococcidiopsis thermalis]|uniref:Uncharacterized protein n=1 Tax=Chroococcidiopsis thermalis (strain PCC 7203) TaxID=251229 RepID=K9TY22_CHRTP|nr:hypothetical protein [Chroococcidiopsis thermalis]AFY87081.1 hypothetical protein Chro_1557 [Chroococcidiopsis thermalis PCC 7203]